MKKKVNVLNDQAEVYVRLFERAYGHFDTSERDMLVSLFNLSIKEATEKAKQSFVSLVSDKIKQLEAA